MQIPDNPPKTGKSVILDEQLAVWWKFINGLGVASFLMFTQCLGLNEWRYLTAVLCCVLVIWAYAYGWGYFPALLIQIRKIDKKAFRSLEKEVWKAFLYRQPWAFIPAFIGFISLLVLAFFPLIQHDWCAYAPFLK